MAIEKRQNQFFSQRDTATCLDTSKTIAFFTETLFGNRFVTAVSVASMLQTAPIVLLIEKALREVLFASERVLKLFFHWDSNLGPPGYQADTVTN